MQYFNFNHYFIEQAFIGKQVKDEVLTVLKPFYQELPRSNTGECSVPVSIKK